MVLQKKYNRRVPKMMREHEIRVKAERIADCQLHQIPVALNWLNNAMNILEDEDSVYFGYVMNVYVMLLMKLKRGVE